MLVYLSEAARMAIRKVQVEFRGIRKYAGSADKICSNVIRGCFNQDKNYFMTSSGHFSEFYCRDFGWCAESLVKLGYRDQVIATLDYAIAIFERHGRVEQSISPAGSAFTFPKVYSPDALAFLVHALAVSHADILVGKYKSFLESEVRRYFDVVVDKKTGLVKRRVHFSSMKDYSIRSSSCYDNVITGLLSSELTKLGLKNPLKRYDYAALLKKHFWTGDYFLDDLSGRREVCGDANVLPFWSGLIDDKRMLKKAVDAIRKTGLDKPFPLKYTAKRIQNQKMISYEWFAGDYERDAIWAHVGLMYIDVLSRIDRGAAKKCLRQYNSQILRHKNFLEVFDRNGRPFKTLFYYSDEGMLWAANYSVLHKRLF